MMIHDFKTMTQGHYKTMTGMAESCLKPEAGGVKPKVEHQFLWIVLYDF